MHIIRFYKILILLLVFAYKASPAQYYEKVYDSNPFIKPVFFHTTSDHGLVILANKTDSALTSSGYYILKLDSEGNELWHKEYIDIFPAYGRSITTIADGKIVILGTHAGVLYQNVAEIMVLDSEGNFLNYKSYPPFSGWGSAGVAMTNYGDSAVSIIIYNDGFISNNYYSIFTINPDLSINWNDFVGFDGSYTTEHGISSSVNGVVYTSAYYDDYPYATVSMQQVTSVKRHDSSGTLLLDSIYEFQCVTTGIESTLDGGAVIFGTQYNSGQRDLELIRIDSSGIVLWQHTYGSEIDEESKTVIETQDGGFAMLANVSDLVLPKQHDLFLIKLNSLGDSIWSKKFGGTFDEAPLDIKKDSTDLLLLGLTSSFNDNHIYVVSCDSSGVIQSNYNIVPNGRYFCEGNIAALELTPAPGPGMHVQWSNGDTIYPDSVTVTGNYYAIITDSLGNSQQTPYIPVYFALIPNVNIGPDSVSLCDGTVLVDSGNNEITNTYHWYLDGVQLIDEITHSIIPQQPGFYQLVIGNYCVSDTGSVLVDSIYRLPNPPNITAPPVDYVCAGDSLRLSILLDSNQTCQWFTVNVFGATSIPGAVDTVYYANHYGDYLLQVTDLNGCSAFSPSYSVSYDLDQEFVIANGPSGFCTGGEVVLSVSQGTSYLWSNGDTIQNITVDSTGEYFVSFTDVYGCFKNSDTIAISVFDNPYVFIGSDTNLCSGASLILDAGPGFNNYLWNDASTSQTYLALPVGPFPDTSIYSVFVIDSNGCTNGDTLSIFFDICAGLNSMPAQFNSIYPNPIFKGEQLHLSSPSSDKETFILYDILNHEVIRKEFNSAALISETSKLNPGVYVYRIIYDKSQYISGKLIVQ